MPPLGQLDCSDFDRRSMESIVIDDFLLVDPQARTVIGEERELPPPRRGDMNLSIECNREVVFAMTLGQPDSLSDTDAHRGRVFERRTAIGERSFEVGLAEAGDFEDQRLPGGVA